MGLQDRDYYQDKLAERNGTAGPRPTSGDRPVANDPFAAEMRRQQHRLQPRRSPGWGRWVMAGCWAFVALVACAAVWMGRR